MGDALEHLQHSWLPRLTGEVRAATGWQRCPKPGSRPFSEGIRARLGSQHLVQHVGWPGHTGEGRGGSARSYRRLMAQAPLTGWPRDPGDRGETAAPLEAYDRLPECDQAVVRVAWAERIVTLRKRLNCKATFEAAGESNSEADADGNVVIR